MRIERLVFANICYTIEMVNNHKTYLYFSYFYKKSSAIFVLLTYFGGDQPRIAICSNNIIINQKFPGCLRYVRLILLAGKCITPDFQKKLSSNQIKLLMSQQIQMSKVKVSKFRLRAEIN